ncbi:MAG: TonB-dependent receptor [Balneolales bacterium]
MMKQKLLMTICLIFGLFTAGLAQSRTVEGTITDAEVEDVLPGVNIQIEGTNVGTTTDLEGRYSIEVEGPESVLIFSYVGYLTEEIAVGDRNVIDVAMESDFARLDEMVVVGYGAVQRSDLTGSISSVDSETIEKVSSHDLAGALQGRVAGVNITGTSGGPGAGSSVRIRGVGTTGGNEPLYVVDGFPITSGNMGIPGSSENISGLSVINPSDILNIEVLKDAAAASIYGARAANGVILITTKSGEAGQTSFTVNSYTGYSQVWKKPEVLNAEELATLANELWVNSGMEPHSDFSNPQALGEGTDWMSAIFRNAPVSNLDFSISGGTENVQARLSFGALDQTGTMIETGHQRYTGRATIDLTPNDRFKFGATFAFAQTEGRGVRNQLHNRGIINLSQQMFPHLELDDVIGDNVPYATSQGDNPILRARDQGHQLSNARTNINGFGEFEIIENLLFRTSLGVEFDNNRTSQWDPTANRGHFRNLRASLNENYSRGNNALLENTLTYTTEIDDVHRISAVVGQTAQRNKSDFISARGIDYLNEQINVINGSNSSEREASGSMSEYRLASYLGRINYAFDDKYILSASIRRDGSSNFGPKNKWGNFPSVSAAWNINQEAFFEGVPYMNELRLRGSWGRLGNDNIGSFGYMSMYTLGTNANNYILGENQNLAIGAHMSRPGNPDLKWETSEQINFAIDAGFFEGRLYSTIEYYEKVTSDMLVALPISYEAGFSAAPNVNGGEILNRGWEFELGLREQSTNLRWDIGANLSTLHNEVLSLGQGQPIIGGRTMYGSGMPITYTEVGEEIGYFKGYEVEGIYQTVDEIDQDFQSNAQPGDFQWRDIDGDGVLTDDDAVKLGSPWPDFTYGANLNMNYRNIDFNLVLAGVSGVQIMNKMIESTYPVRYFGGSGIVNANKRAMDRWTPENGGNTVPRLIEDDANGNYATMSSFYVEDGDYMRIRNVTLGYTIPTSIVEHTNLLSNMRVYVSAQNLFTFTGYSGFDPEITSSNPLSSGIDDGIYPMARTFMLGLNLRF